MNAQPPGLQTGAGSVNEVSFAAGDRDFWLTAAGAPPSHGVVDAAVLRAFMRRLFSIPTSSQENFMAIQAINVRNQFKGQVKEILRGDVLSEVDVQTPWGVVTSVITTRSIDELGLRVGSDVVALVKSTEVSIAKL